ncbi:hypothetical protein DL768_005574 [Monosporascus sp. mg162]|nr:hypothetical protein DL768_005574 [Monosporascus sp. mg162]
MEFLTFRHASLPADDPKSFRLLRLLPITSKGSDKALICEIITTSLSSQPRYEALSYCWDSDSSAPPVHLLIQDTAASDSSSTVYKTLTVTHNCAAALLALRYRIRSRLLWIDAICIDQTSDTDKARQIPMMGDIYRFAKGGVIIWLGEGTEDSSAEMLRLRSFVAFERAFLPGAVLSILGRLYMACNKRKGDPIETPLPFELGLDMWSSMDDPSMWNILLAGTVVAAHGLPRSWDICWEEARRIYDPRSPLAYARLLPRVVSAVIGTTFIGAPTFFLNPDWVLNQPWFSRMWVIQEAALAAVGGVRISVLCGHRRCSWTDFRRYPSISDKVIRLPLKTPPINASVRYYKLNIHNVLEQHLKVQSHGLDGRGGGGTARPGGIASEVLLFCQYQATSNPHDKVYALYGMLAELGVKDLPVVDYGKPVGEVYYGVCRTVMTYDYSLKLLLGCHRIRPADGTRQAPSWVPNFSTSDVPFPLWAAVHVKGEEWQACGTSLPNFEFVEVTSDKISSTLQDLIRTNEWQNADRTTEQNDSLLPMSPAVDGETPAISSSATTTKPEDCCSSPAGKEVGEPRVGCRLRARGRAVDRVEACEKGPETKPLGIASIQPDGGLNAAGSQFAEMFIRWVMLASRVGAYPTGESSSHAFTNTIHRQLCEEDEMSHWSHSTVEGIFRHVINYQQAGGQRAIAEICEDVFLLAKKLSNDAIDIEDMCYLQSFFVTAGGYMGIGSTEIREGDEVWLLSGLPVPILLRPNGACSIVVSPVYVHGMMEGQFWQHQDLQNVELV